MAGINPFQPPINYSIDVQSPFEAALGGFKLGAAGAEVQAKQAEAQAKETARKNAMDAQAKVQALLADKNATASQLTQASFLLPEAQANNVLKIAGEMTTVQNQNILSQAGEVYSALKAGQPEIAKQLLQDQIDAHRNSGNEPKAKATETYLKLIGVNPTGAQNTIGIMMAMMPGGKEILENVDKTLSTSRLEALAPEAQRKAVADADAAIADAKTKQATAITAPDKTAADLALAKANAAKAAVDAKYAEQVALADLKKKAADLGLTNAQIGSALAQARKLSLESQKAVLELEALKAGTPDPAKAFEQEEKLRKEFQVRNKVYGELGTTYSNIESSSKAKSGPGDIALITGFMKMLDPGSVVRETEFATARDTAGLYTRLENSLKRAESGQFLQPKQREEFVNLAKQYLDSAQKKSGEDRKALGVVVKNYKLNPDNVFGPEKTATNDPNIVIVGGRNYIRPANFTDAQWTEYKKSVGAQ